MCCFPDSSSWRRCQRLEKQQLFPKPFVSPPARSAQRESRDVRPAASSGSSLSMEKQHPDKRERLPGKSRALMHSPSNYSDKTVPRAGNSPPWNNEGSGFCSLPVWALGPAQKSLCKRNHIQEILSHFFMQIPKKVQPPAQSPSRAGKKGTETEGIVRVPLEFHLQIQHLPPFSIVFPLQISPSWLNFLSLDDVQSILLDRWFGIGKQSVANPGRIIPFL